MHTPSYAGHDDGQYVPPRPTGDNDALAPRGQRRHSPGREDN